MSPDIQRLCDDDGEMLVATACVEAFSPAWFVSGSHAARAGELSGGRGSVGVIDTAIGPLVRREYLRGGLPRHLSRDRYLWTGAERTRSFREFRLLLDLHRRGLPVPEPVAARYRRAGLGYRAVLLTRLIPGARTLAQALAEQADPGAQLTPVADAIADLHRAGVWHADLNAANVLVDADGRVWLVDFDRARAGMRDAERLAGNLDRLLRSLRKLLGGTALARVEAVWPAFCTHYRNALAARPAEAS